MTTIVELNKSLLEGQSIDPSLARLRRLSMGTREVPWIGGSGDLSASLVLVGLCPRAVDQQALRSNLRAAQVYDKVYLTYLVKWNVSPGAINGPELRDCTPYLYDEMRHFQPEVVMTMGNEVTRRFIGAGVPPVTVSHGSTHPTKRGLVIPTVHPHGEMHDIFSGDLRVALDVLRKAEEVHY